MQCQTYQTLSIAYLPSIYISSLILPFLQSSMTAHLTQLYAFSYQITINYDDANYHYIHSGSYASSHTLPLTCINVNALYDFHKNAARHRLTMRPQHICMWHTMHFTHKIYCDRLCFVCQTSSYHHYNSTMEIFLFGPQQWDDPYSLSKAYSYLLATPTYTNN